jgi:starch-binding outer membrane protein, SusD/RagB family
MKAKYLTGVALAGLLMAGCDSPLDVSPADSIDAATAINNTRAAQLALGGAYDALQYTAMYSRELVVWPELWADNLDFTGTFTTDAEVANNNIFPDNVSVRDAWHGSYRGINRVNNVLAGLETITDATEAQRRQIRGEALFLRALNYSNLVRYFGGVPIVTEPTAGVGEQNLRPRSTAAEVWALVESDLIESAQLLTETRRNGRATRGAANALLARVSLEMGKWEQARDRATAVIDSDVYSLVPEYGTLFTNKNSAESIFEVQYSINDSNALAFWFFPQALGGRRGIAPSAGLNAAYEAGDERRAATIGTSGGARYGVKYFRVASNDDNVIVLRLAEMYLARAEANARLGAPAATVRADIDEVRERAGLDPLPTTVTGTEALIDAILAERRVEFALEGHRFFDLRRNLRAQSVLDIGPNQLLFPIPQSEIDVNPNLQQNPGY